MIVVRNVFRVKFGKAKDAVAAMKANVEMMKKAGVGGETRILTDLTGTFYTLVLESTHESLAAWESMTKSTMGNEEWKAAYGKLTPLVEEGYREIFTVV